MTEVKDKLTITINGEPKTIKMTFGLKNTLARVMGDITAIAELAIDADLRDAVIYETLAERDEEGNIVKKPNLFYLDISSEEIIDLLDWVGGHVLDFLLETATRSKATLMQNEKKLKALQLTSSGG